MNSHKHFEAITRTISDSNMYMMLGRADDNG
jgi:hypothetical protein